MRVMLSLFELIVDNVQSFNNEALTRLVICKVTSNLSYQINVLFYTYKYSIFACHM